MTTVNEGTLLIDVDTLAYPVMLSQARRLRLDYSFAAQPSEELMAELGFAVVHPQTPPLGDVVTEGQPTLVDGQYVQTWEVRAYSPEEYSIKLDEMRTGLLLKIADLQTSSLKKGSPYTFPDGLVEHVQLRDGDRANLAGLSQKAAKAVLVDPSMPFYFRTFENNLKALSAEEMVELTDASFGMYMLIMSKIWALNDLVANATTIPQLPVIPDELDLSS